MKYKVGLCNKKLIKEFFLIISAASVLISFFAVVIDVPDRYKISVAVMMICAMAVFYIGLLIRANIMSDVKLQINNSVMEIRFGDIFAEPEWKVICFNEYFDTQVDNVIISENSLNGKYIKEHVDDISGLDRRLERDNHLMKRVGGNNPDRDHGKKTKYKLGTIFKDGDYLLTAFTKFDNDNRAFISMQEYIDFLMNFWNEVDIVYSGKSVAVPLMGSGITRFKDYNINEQELLELIIWSFKVSRVKFVYPSRVSVILHTSVKDKINLYDLKS